MTIRHSQQLVTVWCIELGFKDYKPYFADEPRLYVSAKGYPSTRALARFESKKHAIKFLDLNRQEITRRCGSHPKFSDFLITSYKTDPPIRYDLPISLRGVGKRGPSRSSLYRNGVR